MKTQSYTEVELPNIEVMYVSAEGGPKGAPAAFNKLEANLSSLKGRKFYGVMIGKPDTGEYRACMQITADDDPKIMGFETWTIPNGKYARKKIKDWTKNTPLIATTFKELEKECELDPTRPTIEFYRSMRDLFCLLPIK